MRRDRDIDPAIENNIPDVDADFLDNLSRIVIILKTDLSVFDYSYPSMAEKPFILIPDDLFILGDYKLLYMEYNKHIKWFLLMETNNFVIAAFYFMMRVIASVLNKLEVLRESPNSFNLATQFERLLEGTLS